MTYIGIDPGKSGALAMIDDDVIFAVPFDETAYLSELQTVDPSKAIVCLEHVSAMPGQGVSTINVRPEPWEDRHEILHSDHGQR